MHEMKAEIQTLKMKLREEQRGKEEEVKKIEEESKLTRDEIHTLKLKLSEEKRLKKIEEKERERLDGILDVLLKDEREDNEREDKDEFDEREEEEKDEEQGNSKVGVGDGAMCDHPREGPGRSERGDGDIERDLGSEESRRRQDMQDRELAERIIKEYGRFG